MSHQTMLSSLWEVFKSPFGCIIFIINTNGNHVLFGILEMIIVYTGVIEPVKFL